MSSVPSHTVRVPARLDFGGTLELLSLLESAPETESYLFDFVDFQWINPLGLVLGSTLLRRYIAARANSAFKATRFDENCYAGQMGFFQAFGLKRGKVPGQAPGSNTYIPITCITVADLYTDASTNREPVQESIDRRARTITQIVTRAVTGPLFDTLSYSLREILRNAAEHSQSDRIWYAAQYWPKKEAVEVAIVDEGIGVRRSLACNPHLSIEDDDHALSLALLPGVSGSAFKGATIDQEDPWHNSGYGLFMTSRLCASDGRFFIGSGNGGLILTADAKNRLPFQFAGVAIEMVLSTRNLPSLADALARLNKEGVLVARQIKGSALDAPSASRMLLRSQS